MKAVKSQKQIPINQHLNAGLSGNFIICRFYSHPLLLLKLISADRSG